MRPGTITLDGDTAPRDRDQRPPQRAIGQKVRRVHAHVVIGTLHQQLKRHARGGGAIGR